MWCFQDKCWSVITPKYLFTCAHQLGHMKYFLGPPVHFEEKADVSPVQMPIHQVPVVK